MQVYYTGAHAVQKNQNRFHPKAPVMAAFNFKWWAPPHGRWRNGAQLQTIIQSSTSHTGLSSYRSYVDAGYMCNHQRRIIRRSYQEVTHFTKSEFWLGQSQLWMGQVQIWAGNAVMKKKTRNPKKNPWKNNWTKKKQFNQKENVPKATKVLLSTSKLFFIDKTHGNNFFVLHIPPEVFTKSKIKAKLRQKMHQK